MQQKYLWITGLIAVIGAAVTGVGEWLMLYSPDMGYGAAAGHQNFLYASPERLKLGFFMGVLGAPIYLLGYWHVSYMLKLTVKWRWIMMIFATLAFIVGSVWLATNAYIALMVQASFNAGGETAALMQVLIRQVELLSLPLLGVVRLGVLGLSAITVFKIVKGDTHYPYWVIPLVPFMLIIYIFGFFFTAPNLGNYLIPAALNVAHTIFFIISTTLAYRVVNK